MKFWNFVPCILAAAAILLAQSAAAQYQPAVPEGDTVNAGGYYPGTQGASTAAGSAMNGMANAVSAMGSYNLSTSAAAVNMTQARRNSIENSQMYTDTYFQMRAANRAYRAAEASPRPTAEQIARLARDGAPRPLSPGDLNSVSGEINWPPALQQESFAAHRAQLDQLSATMATHGTLAISDQMAARHTIETMFADLKSQITDIPPQEYVASRNFLQSLIYTTSRSQL